MPVYEVTDPRTGKTLELTGDSPPTEQELEEIFSSVGNGQPERSGLARAWETANADIPVVGPAVEALRNDIPAAIAEKTGALAEKAGLAGPIVKGAGVAAAGTIGMAGELLPKTRLDAGLMLAAGPLGRGATSVGARMLPPLEQRAPNVVKAVKAALAANILPTPAQILQSRPVAAMEEVASRIPFFGSRIMAMREAQEKAYQSLRTGVVEAAGAKVPASELGEATQGAIHGALAEQTAQREAELARLHRALLDRQGDPVAREQIGRQLDEIRIAKTEEARQTAEKLYRQVEEAIPAEMDQVADGQLRATADKVLKEYENVPTASLDARARKLLEDLRSGPGSKVIENAQDPIGTFDPLLFGGQAEVAQAITQRKAYTFNEMQTMRSTLNGLIQQERLKVPPGQMTVEGRIYKNLKAALDGDIDTFAEGLPSDLKKKFDVATAYYRDHYKATYANTTMKTLGRAAKDDPENVYKLLVQPGDVSDVRRLKKVVGEPGMGPVRRRFIEDLVTGQDGKILGGADITQKLAKYGDETLRELLTPDQLRDVLRYKQARELPRFVESELERRLRGLIYQSEGMYRAPEEVVRRVVDGDVMTLRAVKRIVGPQGTQQYKRRVIEEILGEAADPMLLPGQVPAKTSLGVLKALKSYDENFLKELFTGQELDDIGRIDTIKALLESQPRLSANAPNTAAAMIAPAVSGAGGALLIFSPLKAAAVAISADVLSRLYTSPAGRRLLIEGMNPRLAKNAPLYGRIMTAVANAQREKAREDRINQGVNVK